MWRRQGSCGYAVAPPEASRSAATNSVSVSSGNLRATAASNSRSVVPVLIRCLMVSVIGVVSSMEAFQFTRA